MDAGHRGRSKADDVAALTRARDWYWANRLDWTVKLDGRVIARFIDERDARGFAQARYRGDASVERRHQRKRECRRTAVA